MQKQKAYYDKIERSIKKKEKLDKFRLEEIKVLNEKKNDSVSNNLHQLKSKQKDQTRYYDQRIK